ncbi:MAG TPA: GDSL-type esterase/lipase family protein [Phycisphaerae bacterium]|nr:GDSL-type esterase/lipase family protein [Phycisphaerae bacterium]
MSTAAVLLATIATTLSAQPTSSASAPVTATASVPAPVETAAPAPPPVRATLPAPSPATNAAPAPPTAPASMPTTAPAPPGSLAIREGDVIVFLGDELSETPDARRGGRPTFPQLVETFLTVRYPELHRSPSADGPRPVRYISVGWAGDTAARALLRLERDVLIHKPTVVVVCLGINDAGYLSFVPARLEAMQRDLTKIVQKCHEAGARVWLMSPPCVEEERGKKARVVRDGQRAVADLEVIRYNETLAKYAAAMREIAAANPPAGFADWFAEASAASRQVRAYPGEDWLTTDGRTLTFHGTTIGATTLLRAWGAEPIRALLELDWTDGTARISTHQGQSSTMLVQIADDEKRILSVDNLPLPWPLPSEAGVGLQSGWKAADLCQIILRVPDPPEQGITLVQETDDHGATAQWPITAAQLQAGFNLVTAEPLRSPKGVRDLYNLIVTKNRTRDTIWRRLELSAPQEPELTDGHRQLIEAWKAYVAGYERIIYRYPKTFSARFTLSETTESEHLPTSQPTRLPRVVPSSHNPIPATLPAAVHP